MYCSSYNKSYSQADTFLVTNSVVGKHFPGNPGYQVHRNCHFKKPEIHFTDRNIDETFSM